MRRKPFLLPALSLVCAAALTLGCRPRRPESMNDANPDAARKAPRIERPRAKLGLRGEILDAGCITRPVSLGSRHGLHEGDILDVRRGGERIGRARVTTVWTDFAGVIITERTRPIKPGDVVVLSKLAPSEQ